MIFEIWKRSKDAFQKKDLPDILLYDSFNFGTKIEESILITPLNFNLTYMQIYDSIPTFLKAHTSFRYILLLGLFFLNGCLVDNTVKPGDNKKIEGFQENVKTQTTENPTSTGEITSFVQSSKIVIPAVVHIKTIYSRNGKQAGNFYDQLRNAPQDGVYAMASGSGVVISADGYIATNNHVIENASSIEVIFPTRESYTAKLVGSDLNTDLALLKVEAKDLPFVQFGNSDNAQIGEWVLAVGYPLSLNSTVTAGIISAKGRSIGIINQADRSRFSTSEPVSGNTAIESFIQTDAAINPGNSGGALVNTKGELIGINTAIASQTGSYAGYAFAIPVNLAKKVLEDLKTFGTVQRGILGVSFPSPAVEEQYLKQQGLDPGKINGVYITGVQKGSSANKAGLKEGDIIQSIDGNALQSSSEFSERIARHRPNDQILLTYLRDGKSNTVTATLDAEPKQEQQDAVALQKIYEKLGASFEPIPTEIKEHFDIRSGVVVTDVMSGGFFERIGIPEGTIIVNINGKPINDPKDIDTALLSSQTGTIKIMAIAPDGSRVIFSFSLGT